MQIDFGQKRVWIGTAEVTVYLLVAMLLCVLADVPPESQIGSAADPR